MKNKKNKITNLLKIGILFFGVSLLLWNCEKDEFTSHPNQSNLLSKLQSEFNPESFKKAIPYEFEVIWNNENKIYHKELEKYYYEFPINFTNSFNPNNFKTKNVSKYSTIYKVFVVENENQEHSFYIYKSYTENINKKKLKENKILFEDEISNGFNHILDSEGEIVYAEKIVNGKKDENILFNKEFKKKKTKDNYQSRMMQDCYTVTTYHYTDNYIKWGDGPFIYVSSTFNGTSTETICDSYWLPDLNISGGGNSGGYYTNPGNSPAYQDCQSNSNKNYQGRYVEESNPCKYVISVNPIECGNGYVYDPVLGTCVEEVKIINELTNPCAKTIFTQLENGIYQDHPLKPELQILALNTGNLNFSEQILHLFAESNQNQYTITNADLAPGKAAETNPTTNTTTINNSYLENATMLSITRTMIHEQIHAYLNNVYKYRTGFKDKDLYTKMHIYASENGYKDLNRFHHEFMGQYVNAIAVSLYEWDSDYGSGGNLGWDYYYSMSFGGLFYDKNPDPDIVEIELTDSFKELVPNATDRNKIIEILKNEESGNSNAKGKKCN